MSEKRFTYSTTIITDKKGYRKDYIWSNETVLHTEQIVGILNAQDKKIKELEKEKIELNEENKRLNAFLVHNDFAEEYIRWKRNGDQYIVRGA